MQVMGSDRLRALLQELPDQDRFLLECRIVDGWDYAELSARLGVPYAVLLRRVREIRTELRRKARTMLAGRPPNSGGAGYCSGFPSLE